MVKKTDDHSRLSVRLVGLFIVALLLTGLAERGVNALVNTYILPMVAQRVFPESTLEKLPLSSAAVIIFALAALMILFVAEFALPMISPVTDRFTNFLVTTINNRVEGSAMNIPMQRMSAPTALLLLLLFLGVLALYLLPYLAAASLYSRFVIKETDKIRQREEKAYKEYEEGRNLMLSDIAHDLRNPITTVSGYAKAMSDGLITDPEQQKQYLKAIERKSLRVNDLINLLFEYTKLNSSGFRLNTEALDLNELVRENTAIMYDEIESRDISLDVDIPDEPFNVTGDRIQLSRVISNLITNAIRHNPAGTRLLVQTVSAAETEAIHSYSQLKQRAVSPDPLLESGCGYIIIADSGPEIPEDIREHIFEPFTTGDSSRSANGGSGLGLSIAAKVTEMHNWELKLVSGYRGYTKAFLIRIPTV